MKAKKEPRILVFDIETSPVITTTFSLYPDSISHNNILQDWFVICACWRIVGENKVEEAHVNSPTKDYQVVKKLRDAIAKADVIVAHNGKKFDLKKLNARLIFHKLPPLPEVPIVDTLIEVKKIAQFTSHRLDYLGKHLLGHGKLPTSDGLWLDALKGKKSAILEMVEYCKVDVVRLEEFYLRLKPYIKRHPHVGVITGKDKASCPKCGETKLHKRGVKTNSTGTLYQSLQCTSCKSYHQVPFKEKKK